MFTQPNSMAWTIASYSILNSGLKLKRMKGRGAHRWSWEDNFTSILRFYVSCINDRFSSRSFISTWVPSIYPFRGMYLLLLSLNHSQDQKWFPFSVIYQGHRVIGPYLIHVALDPTVFSNTITNMHINLKAQIMSLLWIVS